MSSAATSRSLSAIRPVGDWLFRSLTRCLRQPARHVLLLLTLCGFLFFYGLSTGELYRTETLRAIVAAEFLRSGNWIVPTLYDEPLLTKPPGMYAAIALASWPGGEVTEWSARLPSALAATLTVFLFYWYFGRVLGQFAGLIAALSLPLSLLWLDKASAAEIDMLQVFWVSAAIVFFLRALETSSPAVTSGLRHDARRWWLAALLCVAGGVLTKWTAPLFFYATVVPLLWWRGQLRILGGRQHLLAGAVAASICLAWVGAVMLQVGWETFYTTVAREALVRFSPGHYPKPYSWSETFTHPLRFLIAAAPISLFARPACRPQFGADLDERERFLWQAMNCWVWPSLLFWSLVPDHALRNSMPLYPGIAGLAALVVWKRETRASEVEPSGQVRRLAPILLVVLIGWLVVKVVFVQVVVPDRLHGREARAKGERIAARVPRHATLYLFRLKDEGLMFYYGRRAVRLAGPEQLSSTTEPMYCILAECEWAAWDRQRPAEAILHLTDAQGAPITLVRVWPLRDASSFAKVLISLREMRFISQSEMSTE